MSILIPGTSHVITWSIQNITDTTTYYVKAVIRDVRAGIVLDTLYLTDLGNGRFSKSWNIPQDGSGFGRQIEIEKTVYEDSGYTTPSGLYGRWLDQYTILNVAIRPGPTGGYGGHGQSLIDYKEISNIIDRKIKPLQEAVEMLLKQEEKETTTQTLIPKLENLNKSILVGLAGLSHRLTALEDKTDDNCADISKVETLIDKSTKASSMELDSKISDIVNMVGTLEKGIAELFKKHEKTEKEEISIFKKATVTDFDTFIKGIKKDLEDEMDKLKSHINEAMSKPFNIVMKPERPAETIDQTKKDRELRIKRLLR